MKTAMKSNDDPKVLMIERTFNAPRTRVFKAWTNPDDLIQWAGPSHHPVISVDGDCRVGGEWHSVLRGVEDGRELPQHGVYKAVREPELLSYTFNWDDHDEENVETMVTVHFEAQGDKTRVIFHQEPFLTRANRDGHNEGWNSSFDRLDAFLKK